MFSELDIFRTAHAMASHAGRQQEAIARNIANSDTPGYRTREVPSFSEILDGDTGLAMRRTRPGHIAPDPAGPATGIGRATGNPVSIEEEMLKATGVARDHERALAIYRSSLSVLRSSLGRF